MSLSCAETERIMDYGEPLFACTPSDKSMLSALSKEVVNRIPEEDRCPDPRPPDDKGLNIHRGSAGPNPPWGSYAWTSFELGEFLFSISEEVARTYLPNFYGKLSGETQPRPPKVELSMSQDFIDALRAEKGGEERYQELLLEFGNEGSSH